MSENTGIEKKYFNLVCVIAGALAILVIVLFFKKPSGNESKNIVVNNTDRIINSDVIIRDPQPLPFSVDLTKTLSKKRVQVVLLADGNGRVRIVNIKGEDANFCTLVPSSTVTSCGLNNVAVEQLIPASLITTSKSPGCTRISAGDYLFGGC